MSSWLGVGVLVLFSIALSLFMRLEAEPKASIPDELRRWTRLPGETTDTYVERRVVELARRGFRGARWVEQRRVRRASDHEIVRVLQERPFRRG